MSTRFWKFSALLLSLIILPAVARAQAMQSVCKDGTKSMTAGKGTCSGHSGVDEAATKDLRASGKTFMCTDGTMSAGGRGACSGHGGIGKKGVEKGLKAERQDEKKEVTAAKKEEKKEVTAAKMDEKKEMTAAKKEAKAAIRDAKADRKRPITAKKDAKAPA